MSEPQCEHEWERPWVQMVEGHATPVGAFRCRKCRAQRESVQEAVTTTQPPEPSVPLSAIRALVEQWREEADALEALRPAPPEDQP